MVGLIYIFLMVNILGCFVNLC